MVRYISDGRPQVTTMAYGIRHFDYGTFLYNWRQCDASWLGINGFTLLRNGQSVLVVVGSLEEPFCGVGAVQQL